MSKTVLLLLLITITVINIHAQEKAPNQRDSSIIIFSESPKNSIKRKKGTSGERNVVKLAPFGFLRGVIPVYYERRISNLFTIQVGAGPTIRPLIRQISRGLYNNENATGKDNFTWSNGGKDYEDEDKLTNREYRVAKTGYYFSIQPRIYVGDDTPAGPYIAVSYDYYRYNFQSNKLIGDGSNKRGNTRVGEYENIVDLIANFGTQYLYERFSFDWNSGIGVKKIAGKKYAVASIENGSYVDGMNNYNKTTLAVEFGVRIGYHF